MNCFFWRRQIRSSRGPSWIRVKLRPCPLGSTENVARDMAHETRLTVCRKPVIIRSVGEAEGGPDGDGFCCAPGAVGGSAPCLRRCHPQARRRGHREGVTGPTEAEPVTQGDDDAAANGGPGRCGNLAKAVPSSKVVLESRPDYVPALAVRMLSLRVAGKPEEARKAAARILELDEDPKSPWRRLAEKARKPRPVGPAAVKSK